MAKKTSIEEVQQLIDLGKEKGFLTYEEVNDILPADMVSSEQIEDVMTMFGEIGRRQSCARCKIGHHSG